MFKANEKSMLNLFISIAETLEKSRLEAQTLAGLAGKIKQAADFLGCDEESAAFFAIMFVLQNQGKEEVNLHDIAEFLDYSFIHILEFRGVISALEDACLIYVKNRFADRTESNGYRISGSVMTDVIDGTPVVHLQEEETTETVLAGLYSIESSYSKNEMNETEYKRELVRYETKHAECVVVKNICALFKDDFESRILLYAICHWFMMGRLAVLWATDEKKLDILPKTKKAARMKSLSDETDILMKEGLIKRGVIIDGGFRERYDITKEGLKRIFGDEAENYIGTVAEETELEQTLHVLRKIAAIFEDESILCISKQMKIDRIEQRNRKLPFFAHMQKSISVSEHRSFLYACIHDRVTFGGDSNLNATLSDLYGQGSKEFNAEFRLFQEEKHPLLEAGFLELIKDEQANNAEVEVGDRALDLLFGESADLYKRKSTAKNIIEPENLPKKTLYYAAEVQEQIDMLASSLTQEHLCAMQKRLAEKALPKGIVALLYGAPGTGKTESVYQIAKRTNRKIFHVDIAESKSCWFGESEKKIKKIFSDYRALCRSCTTHNENIPILLFNEADALISKRKSVESGAVAQTENAMQNILLEEIEKLDGILIATTNLFENMDKAFERRFLFKVKFEKPTVAARSKIWKSKLDWLPDADAQRLAEQFDFSGGEIDNIARKCEISQIIHGTTADTAEIADLCKKERLLTSDTAKHIGFGA